MIVISNEELIISFKCGNKEALDILIEQNKGLIYKIIGQYRSYIIKGQCEEDDLYQEGCIGLMRAADLYNPTHESAASFSTYAIHWINQRISRYFKNNKNDTISLDEYTDDEKSTTRGDSIPNNSPGPEELAEEASIRQVVRDAVRDNLSLQERNVVRLYYGFFGPEVPFNQIGEIIGKTPEQTRSMNYRALRTLRKAKEIARLRRELELDNIHKVNNPSGFHPEQEAMRIIESNKILDKNNLCNCKAKGPFYSWYRNLFIKRKSCSEELSKISAEDYIFSVRRMKNKTEYTDILDKQTRLKEDIALIDKTIAAVNYFTNQLLFYATDPLSWHIVKDRINGDEERVKSHDKIYGKSLRELEDAGIEFICKGLEANNIIIDFNKGKGACNE